MKLRKLLLTAAVVTVLLVLFAVCSNAAKIEIMLLDGIDGNLKTDGVTVTYTGEPLELLTGSTSVGGADDPEEANYLKSKLNRDYGLSPKEYGDYAQPYAWFAGWNTDSRGNGEYITEINDVTIEKIKNNTIYAMWACPFIFNANGGVFTDVEGQPTYIKAYRSVTHSQGADGRIYGEAIPTGMPRTLPVKEGFSLETAKAGDVNSESTLGYLWLLWENGSVMTVESPTNTLTPEGATSYWLRLFRNDDGYMEFFSIWLPQIKYNANNGTGKYSVDTRRTGNGNGIIDQSGEVDEYLPYLRSYTFRTPESLGMTAPEGKSFIGWNTQPDGSGRYYQPDKKLSEGTIGSNVAYDLYAIWSSGEQHTITVIGGTASADTSEMGKSITLTLGDIPTGKVFDRWETNIEGITVTKNKFTMPDEDIVITAKYKDGIDSIELTGFEGMSFGHDSEKQSLKAPDGAVYAEDTENITGWQIYERKLAEWKNVNVFEAVIDGKYRYVTQVAITGNDNVFTEAGLKATVDGIEWTVSKITNNTAEIVSPEYSISVPKLPFDDVLTDRWYVKGIAFSYTNGLMKGLSATSFGPDTPTSRAMIVTILYAMEGKPYVKSGNIFTDVEKGKWYEKAVIWAYENGIAAGMGKNTFDPDGNITREQLAVFLYKYAEYKGYDVSVPKGSDLLKSFDDKNDVSKWAVTAVKWAVQSGMLAGSSENGVTLLKPGAEATRAQIATIMMRFVGGRRI